MIFHGGPLCLQGTSENVWRHLIVMSEGTLLASRRQRPETRLHDLISKITSSLCGSCSYGIRNVPRLEAARLWLFVFLLTAPPREDIPVLLMRHSGSKRLSNCQEKCSLFLLHEVQ